MLGNVFMLDLMCIQPYYNRYLCEALLRAGLSVELGSVAPFSESTFYDDHNIPVNGCIKSTFFQMNIGFDRLRRTLNAIEYSLNLSRLAKIFKRETPAIIHAQFLPLWDLVNQEYGFLSANKKRGARLVYTVHNIAPLHKTHRDWKKRNRKMYHLMDCLICHTGEAKKTLVDEYGLGEDRVWTIPHGPIFHDMKRIGQGAARDKLGLGDATLTCLFVGRIRPYKGLEFLLDTMKLVCESENTITLVIAGNGEKEDLAALRKRVDRLKLKDRVQTVFRYITTEELLAYHEAADIIVLPYKEITQSGALLTAMSFGKPTIATRIGGFKDVIVDEENGLLVDYGDESSFAEKILDLARNREKRELLGGNAARTLDEKYSWDTIAESTIECYNYARCN